MSRFLIVALSFFALAASPVLGGVFPASGTVAGSYLRADDHRIGGIAYRLAVKGAGFCPRPYPLTGLMFHHLGEYEASDRPVLIKRYGLDRGLGILGVIDDSPAAAAGLQAGDVILAVNGKPVALNPESAPASATPRRAALEAAESQIEDELRKGLVNLTILRNGWIFAIETGSTPGCPARIRLARSSQTNAFASGRYVTLTTSVLDFARSDDELAVIIGHELAHNILDHPDRLAADKVPKGFLRGFGANAGKVRATEEEADRLGISLVWAAGFDTSAAIPFWRRYYARFDGPQLFRTHPTLEARERLISKRLAELNLGSQRPELREGALSNR